MFGTGFILLTNIIILLIIGAAIQALSYALLHPVINVAGIITYITLIILTLALDYGWILAIILSIVILATKLPRYYKFGASAYLIAIVCVKIASFIMTHLFIGLIFRPFAH